MYGSSIFYTSFIMLYDSYRMSLFSEHILYLENKCHKRWYKTIYSYAEFFFWLDFFRCFLSNKITKFLFFESFSQNQSYFYSSSESFFMSIYILFLCFYKSKIPPMLYYREYTLEFCEREIWFTSDKESEFLHERILEILSKITKKSSLSGGFFIEKSIR